MNFDYPTGGEFLYFAPTFTQRTESPSSTFTYSINEATEIVTRPDGSTLNITGNTRWEIKNGSGASFAKVDYTYANDPGGAQQVSTGTTYDDTGTPTKVGFDHDQYGNVLNVREYGFKVGGSWMVRRRTRNTYVTTQSYIDAYLRNLVSRVELFDALQNTNDGDDVLVAKTEYQHDNYSWAGGIEGYSGSPEPPGHLAGYNSASRCEEMSLR